MSHEDGKEFSSCYLSLSPSRVTISVSDQGHEYRAHQGQDNVPHDEDIRCGRHPEFIERTKTKENVNETQMK